MVVRNDVKLLHVRNLDQISLCVNLTDMKVLWLPVVVYIANDCLEMSHFTHTLTGHRQPTEDTMGQRLRKRIRGPPLQFDRLDLVVHGGPPLEFARLVVHRWITKAEPVFCATIVYATH